MSNPFVAEIRMVGFNFAPLGWATCDGQILPISQNTALFSLLGTNFGGDGTSNFGLPNLQGSAPMSQGQGPGLTPRVIGETGGESTVTLTVNQLPAHNHAVGCQNAVGLQGGPGGNVWAAEARGRTPAYSTAAPNVGMNPLPAAGNNQPHNNMSPYLVVLFVIALQGVFPARS